MASPDFTGVNKFLKFDDIIYATKGMDDEFEAQVKDVLEKLQIDCSLRGQQKENKTIHEGTDLVLLSYNTTRSDTNRGEKWRD